jgi:hypothetical protein
MTLVKHLDPNALGHDEEANRPASLLGRTTQFLERAPQSSPTTSANARSASSSASPASRARYWPNTRIVWRGDSHYGRVEAMDWAEDNDTDYIFGLAGNAALDAELAERVS